MTEIDIPQVMNWLICGENQLTHLDVSHCAKLETLDCSSNAREITVDIGNTFDLSTLPGFDVTRASNWRGGTVAGTILTVDAGCTKVSYTYDVDGATGDKTESFTLLVEMKSNNNTLILDADEAEKFGTIWVDGKPYQGTEKDGKYYIELPDDDRKFAATFTYNQSSSDPHHNYPTGMKVWILTHDDTGYKPIYIPDFDDILQYFGASIRMTGEKGIRMITGIPASKRNALITASLAGYTLEEYGTVIAFADQMTGGSLTLEDSYAKANYAYKRGVSDAIFAQSNGNIQFTNVLVGFTMEQCKEDIAMRPYMKVKDNEGNVSVIYGGIVYRSIGYIAWQNRDVYPKGSDGYNYIWDIINAVYGDNLPS